MSNNRTFDDVDLTVLATLQQNSRTTTAKIARNVGMAPSAVLERIRKLESRKVIQSYEARLDPEALGLPLLAFVFVQVDESVGHMTAGDRLAEIPSVLEVHHVAGEDCYLLKVRVADTTALGAMLRDDIGAVESVRSTRTTIVLETEKEGGSLPMPTRAQ
jgi:Lrp/AsnC family leucine-responsive transcriptional regulator